MTNNQIQNNRSRGGRDPNVERLAYGLGWFSIGLGLAEVAAPGSLAKLIGLRNNSKTRTILRLYGLRELAAGIGILSNPRPAGWMWARVGGDILDLSSLSSARKRDSAKSALAVASVVGVTIADAYVANQLSAEGQHGTSGSETKVVRTIIVDRPMEEAYRMWHDFENLPRFMDFLQSVRYTGDRRTHWIAKGPAGAPVEWDAETTADEPNSMIAWRSVPDSAFQNSGSVRFERAPGNRGTLIRVEVDYSGNRGAYILGKVLHMNVGQRVAHDLRRFKQMLEIGEITQSEASIHEGMHAAQPEPVHQ